MLLSLTLSIIAHCKLIYDTSQIPTIYITLLNVILHHQKLLHATNLFDNSMKLVPSSSPSEAAEKLHYKGTSVMPVNYILSAKADDKDN